MTTFAETDILVPLFLGDVKFVEGFEGIRTCVLCGQSGSCLRLDDVLASCPGCGARVRVRRKKRAADRKDQCHRCHTLVDLQSVLIVEVADAVQSGVPTHLRGCIQCLRAGRWAQTHVTEAGVIGWEDATDMDAIPEWRTDLVHTPRYATFQGEHWLFCHDLPMVYLGEWGRLDFDTARPGAGYELFVEVVQDIDPAAIEDAWESGLGRTSDDSDLQMYVFRCRQCARLRTHSDCG